MAFSFSRITTLLGSTTAINGIITQIENAINSLVSKTSQNSNQMSTTLDMNSNRILNLPTPLANKDPIRLIDLVAVQAGTTVFPAPDTNVRGGVFSSSAPAHRFATGIDNTGTVLYAQPLYSDISGTPTIPVINVKDSPYNAIGDGIADDKATIQLALDAASAAGGGMVIMPAGVYRISSGGLKVFSNVKLFGMGGFSTCIRPDATANSTGTSMGGVTCYASILSVSTVGASVKDIYLDHSTNSTNGNGIQFGEYAASSRTTDGTIEGCVVKANNVQKYLIYTKLADRMRVRNNYCIGDTGGSTPTSTDISGIEIFGGDDVEVVGNTVSNCLAGILIKSQASSNVPSSYVKNARVHDNNVASCSYGIQVNCETGSDKTHENIIVHSNTIRDCANSGIRANHQSGSIVRGLLINGNAIYECKGGIEAWGNSGATVEGAEINANVIKRSALGGATPLVLNSAFNFKVSGNRISAVTYYGMFVDGQNNDISGNQFSGSFTDTAITLQNAASYNNVSGNVIAGNGANGAIDLIGACTNNTFIGNIFRTSPSGSPVIRNDDGLASANTVRSSICDFSPTNAHAPPTTMLRSGSDFFVTNLTGSSYTFGAAGAFAGSRHGRISIDGAGAWREM